MSDDEPRMSLMTTTAMTPRDTAMTTKMGIVMQWATTSTMIVTAEVKDDDAASSSH